MNEDGQGEGMSAGSHTEGIHRYQERTVAWQGDAGKSKEILVDTTSCGTALCGIRTRQSLSSGPR